MGSEHGGRHAHPDEPDEFGTRQLPLVRQDGPAAPAGPAQAGHGSEQPPALDPDPQSVRAVAKRVPSALPAIGRDEVSDLPASARATADRRRREREAASGGTSPDGEPEPEGDPAPPTADAAASRPREPERDPTEPRVPVAVAAGSPGNPDVELVPIGRRSRPPLPSPPPSAPGPDGGGAPRPAGPAASGESPEPTPPAPGPPSPPAAPGPPPPTAAGGGRHAAGEQDAGRAAPPPPPPPPPPPAPPVMGQPPDEPERPEHVEIIEAEIVEDGPRPYTAHDVQTDEWATVPTAPQTPPPAPAGPPDPARGPQGPPSRPRSPVPQGPPPGPAGPRLLGPPPVPRGGDAGPLALPGGPAGPGVLVSDSWGETAPLPPVDDDYQGRRRRGLRRVASRPSRAGWLVVLGVVLSLSAAVAVPFIIARPATEETEAAPTGSALSSTVPTSTFGLGPSGLPIIVAPSTTASPDVSTSATPGATASAGTSGQPPGAPGNLSVSGATTNSLTLSWSAAQGTVSEYRLESCAGSGCSDFVQFGTTTVTSAPISNLAAATTYRFRVRAANSAGNSGYSNVATGTTATPPFEALTLQGEDYASDPAQNPYCGNDWGARLYNNGSSVSFGNIMAPSAGTYHVVVRYGGSSPTVRVTVNGTSYATFGQSGCVSSDPIAVPFNAGSNTVTVTRVRGKSWLWIDWIRIER